MNARPEEPHGKRGRIFSGPTARRLSVAALGTVAGCAEAGQVPASVVVRDSVGIEIVESTRPQWGTGSPWIVDSVPLVDLTASGVGPGHDFVDVRDMVRLPDGRIVLVDEGLDELRSYSPNGEHLRSVGREGDGPGDFRRPQSVERFRGDSLVVWDFWLRRISVFDRELVLGRVTSLREGAPRPSLRLFWLGDSTFVGTEPTSVFMELGYYRQPVQLTRYAFVSQGRDSLATLAGYEGYSLERGDARPPFGKQSHFTVRDDRIVTGDANDVEFDVRAIDGRLTQIVRVPGYVLEVTPAEREREMTTLIPPEAPPPLLALLDEMPIPDRKPAYAELLADALGYLWARRFQSYGDRDGPETWEVFSPEGAWMGAVSSPPGFDVMEVGQDYVAGVYVDELGVHHPRVLALRRVRR